MALSVALSVALKDRHVYVSVTVLLPVTLPVVLVDTEGEKTPILSPEESLGRPDQCRLGGFRDCTSHSVLTGT